MNIRDVAQELKITYPKNSDNMFIYEYIRENYIDTAKKRYSKMYQSPSIQPTTQTQRGKFQNTLEHEVYQRADFKPESLEKEINKLFKELQKYDPQTFVFNSGMGAIASLSFYLKNTLDLKETVVGENVYFETKWIFDNYRDIKYINEFRLNIPKRWDILWLEYPINCTSPDEYPFDSQLNIDILTKQINNTCNANPKKQFHFVIDYTLNFLPLNLNRIMSKIPKNLHIYLVTSLQKHRGYGLDLNNGGAITLLNSFADASEKLIKLRAILGTSFTQESLWIMPKINNKLINQLILDSAKNAEDIFNSTRHIKGNVKIYFSNNNDFKTSFIFLVINSDRIKTWTNKPYLSDILIAFIINAAKKRKAILIHGTSFGLPYCRIFKNSERYMNASSLRLAVGYDKEMVKHVSEAITDGLLNFDQYLKQTENQ